MSKPFHVIATPDENGYTVTIPENPNVSAHCSDAADIIPTSTAAREQDEQNRHEKTAVCPKCGKTYTDYPAMSRIDNKTEICPECETREALDAAGVDKAEQDKIIAEFRKQRRAFKPAVCNIRSDRFCNPRKRPRGQYYTLRLYTVSRFRSLYSCGN